MKIVVLDADPAFGSSRAPDSAQRVLEPTTLAALGDLTVHQCTSPEQLLERAKGAEILLTNKVALGERELGSLPALRLISVLATGVNVVDLDAARARGVTVCNVPGYSTMSTAQHCFSLLLELCNHVGLHARDVAEGGWVSSPAFSYFRAPLRELDGQVLGIVGFGAIGQQIAKMGQAFGMRVVVHSRTVRDVPGVAFVDKEALLRESDVVSLHCPLTSETKNFIDAGALSLMKPTALLINGARGPVVDEAALAAALAADSIAGAATDVLAQEPPRADCPLLSAPRCLVTPHIAWATEAARERLLAISTRNVQAFLEGAPQNVVAAP